MKEDRNTRLFQELDGCKTVSLDQEDNAKINLLVMNRCKVQ